MNLIYDQWIPIRRKSGKKEKIAPWQVTEDITSDPIIELAATRPDFNGALIQFLIGLLQTTCAPNGNKEWRSWRDNPPPPEELKRKFNEVAFAFNLDGDGPRFMQDLTLENEAKKTTETIEKLLIDSPGDSTLKENRDFFIKRNRINKLCTGCCAQALLNLQMSAPEGGKGHWAGFRGGGPVNTLIIENNLWKTLWGNVLLSAEFDAMATPTKTDYKSKFPWLFETRVSSATTSKDEKGRKKKTYSNVYTNQDIHPAQIYWAMPRRIRLCFLDEEGECGLCHKEGRLVKEYLTKPYGSKYIGLVHPLTPILKRAGEISARHWQKGESLAYKHWLGYVYNIGDGYEPAGVINVAINRRSTDFRLWAFGYDMDSMKARCWYEGVMPVVTIGDGNKRKLYEAEIACIIQTADSIAVSLRYAIKDAWFDPQQKKSVDLNFIVQRFWQETESDFYRHIAQLREDVMAGNDGISVKQEWHKNVARKAEQIFDEVSQSETIDEVNVKRVAQARNKLMGNIWGKKIREEILGLPKKN